MGIVNRTLDTTQQKKLIEVLIDDTITAREYPIYVVPHAQSLVDAKNACLGLSGAPTMTLKLSRFVAGAGLTTWTIGGALTVKALGTSGIQTYSLPAAGDSLLALQKNDIVYAVAGGTNAAVSDNCVALVVQDLQDIVSWF